MPPGSEGLFFLPYLSGERTPHADPDCSRLLHRPDAAHTRGHMVRERHGRRHLFAAATAWRSSASSGVPVKQIRVSGGGSQKPAVAANSGRRFRPESVTINAEEGPAYGVALLAAVGGGAFKDIVEATNATIRVVKETSVNRAAAAYYDRAFPIYRGLYPALGNDFKRIAALARK